MSQFCTKFGIENEDVSSNVKRVIFMKMLMVAILMVVGAQAGQTSLTMAIPAGKYECIVKDNIGKIILDQKLLIKHNQRTVNLGSKHKYASDSRVNHSNVPYYVISEPQISILIYSNDIRKDTMGYSYYGSRVLFYQDTTTQTPSSEYFGTCYLLK